MKTKHDRPRRGEGRRRRSRRRKEGGHGNAEG